MTPPPRLTNNTTELAKERNRQAAERTLTSWIQACLGLIGFGAGFQSIFDAVNQSFPGSSALFNRGITYMIGLGTVSLGIFLLIPVIIGYRSYLKSLERADFLAHPPCLFNLKLLIGSITLYGLAALAAVLVVRSWG
jgi:putative membrane protein